MKKILLLLICTVSIYGQTLQNPTFGIVTEKNNATDNTPAYFTTTQVDGVHKKTPSALFAKTQAVQDSLDKKLNISDLPTNLTLYPTSVASDVSGYVKMVTDIHDADYNTTAVDVSTPTITGTAQLISQRISAPGVLIGQPGVFNITTFGNIRHLSGSGTAEFFFRVYHRNSAGVETLICQSSTSLPVTNSGYSEFSASGVWDDGDFDATDRIVIKSYANRIAGGSDPVYQFQFGGMSPVRTLLPVPFSVVDAGYEMKTNKSDSYTASSSTTYASTKALVDGLGGKADKIPNTRIVDAYVYGFSPSATGQVNSMAINNALALGGKIIVSIPGIYEIDDTIILPSNTTIEFVKGCTLKHVTPATGRFVNTFKNKGCATSTPNDNISIIGNGLVIDFNGHDGVEGGVTLPFAYQNGRISFYKVNNFNVSGIYVNDLASNYGMYFFQITNCSFGKINDIELKRYPKDGIDIIHSHDVHIKDYLSTTGDDAIFMGSGWLDFDKSLGDTYNIIIENWLSDGIFAGVPSRIITTSWDDWINGRVYAGSSTDASELCVNAGRVYRKTTNGNQTASVAPTHSTGTVIGADGIGWLVVSDVVKYTNDVHNIKYINCQVVNSSGFAHWFYESPTVSQNTHVTILKDVYFDKCLFNSDSGIKPYDYSAFISASASISNLNIFNTTVSFKENTFNLGYNSFINLKQNTNGNKINVDNINIYNVDYKGKNKGSRFIENIGSLLELNKINISSSNIEISQESNSSIVLVSNKDNLKELNISNSTIDGIDKILFFNGSNWTTPTERVVNVLNTNFNNCSHIFTHQYSYPVGMSIYYNASGCTFNNTTGYILDNATSDASMMVLSFIGNKTNTPSNIALYPYQYTRKIFDLEPNFSVLNGVVDPNYISKSIGNNALGNSLIYDNSISIGIGTESPFRKLTLQHTGSVYFGINDTTNNKYSFGSDGNGLVFFDDTHGRYMAKFDKTTGEFSVDGSISATSYSGGATLTGTPTAPTAPAGTTGTQIANLDFVANNFATLSTPSFTGQVDFNGGARMNGTNLYFNSGGTGLIDGVTGAYFKTSYPAAGWYSATRITASVFKTTGYTVATLPTGQQGDTTFVTDATAPTYLGTLTGGGSVVCPVFYNGTAWVAH